MTELAAPERGDGGDRQVLQEDEQGCIDERADTIRHGKLCCVEITIDPMNGKIGRRQLMERQRGEAAEQGANTAP